MYSMLNQSDLHRFIIAKIREARLLAGYNKVEMARRLGMVKSAYQKLEDGDQKFIDVILLVQVADVTGRRLSFFMPPEFATEFATDAATSLQHTYNLDTASTGMILDYAAVVADKVQRERSAGMLDNGTSPSHSEGMAE
jgi:transcriptional regulator with XRE-family HTH domain